MYLRVEVYQKTSKSDRKNEMYQNNYNTLRTA